MGRKNNFKITEPMLNEYYDLSQKKKDIENQLEELQKVFHGYFDHQVGTNEKGELIVNNLKLERIIRKREKFDEEMTVNKLEELNLSDLIQIVKRPDGDKIKSAINLGLLNEKDLDGCITTNSSQAIYVKPLKTK
ncbi:MULTISPECIES: hypothetical protein [unclassified Bacillus (in: firmicutes)]|uniref:hypothetical protein n=1 Tax=unclassified Bacillus (in: firmicutes) TaxID=185979 RepID=UPI000BF1CC25|nr:MULTISPECIES: hypothetical protein [unclassified Bacillus (in: firmicutes)]PEJ56121.1 hypothetical protein CN692_18905 [Bacillus sp. AFS002410]PEK98609.1 hypothetical protein CN601_25155 [Bacillus sp. AFS017336]